MELSSLIFSGIFLIIIIEVFIRLEVKKDMGYGTLLWVLAFCEAILYRKGNKVLFVLVLLFMIAVFIISKKEEKKEKLKHDYKANYVQNAIKRKKSGLDPNGKDNPIEDFGPKDPNENVCPMCGCKLEIRGSSHGMAFYCTNCSYKERI